MTWPGVDPEQADAFRQAYSKTCIIYTNIQNRRPNETEADHPPKRIVAEDIKVLAIVQDRQYGYYTNISYRGWNLRVPVVFSQALIKCNPDKKYIYSPELEPFRTEAR